MPSSKQAPLTAPRGGHEHNFAVPYPHTEAACFDRAEYFAVIKMCHIGEEKEYVKFTMFPWAVRYANRSHSYCLYAVAPSGRFVALDREVWDQWEIRWRENQQILGTFTIYEIPGRKVGCTKDLEGRKMAYSAEEKSNPQMIVREVLKNVTLQEAGDREWWWADELGYQRGTHYTIAAILGRETGFGKFTQERQIELASKGGKMGGPKAFAAKSGIFGLSDEEKRVNNRKGGKAASKINFELKRGIFALTKEQQIANGKKAGGTKRGVCPNCGLEGNIPNLKRWHFDNCRHKAAE